LREDERGDGKYIQDGWEKKLLIELEKQSSENRILQTASIYNLFYNSLCAIHVFVIKESVLHCSPFSTTNFKLGN